MTVKLLTEPHLRFLSLKGACTGSSEYTLVKMPHCWKSRVTAQMHAAKTEENQCTSAVPPVLAAGKHKVGTYPGDVSVPKNSLAPLDCCFLHEYSC